MSELPTEPTSEVIIEPIEEGLLARLPEEVELMHSSSMYRAIHEAVQTARAEREAEAPFTLAYDMSGVLFIDQIGRNFLVKSWKQAEAGNYRLVIRGLNDNPRPRMALKITGLTKFLTFDPSLESDTQ